MICYIVDCVVSNLCTEIVLFSIFQRTRGDIPVVIMSQRIVSSAVSFSVPPFRTALIHGQFYKH